MRLRDTLFCKYETPANLCAKAIRDIAKHMNTMHYYSGLYKEVGTSGRLIMEACLDLYGQFSVSGTDSTKTDAVYAAGQISEHMCDQLHELRKASSQQRGSSALITALPGGQGHSCKCNIRHRRNDLQRLSSG